MVADRTMLRAAARGAVAAMAMSGLRRISTSLGLLEQTPPEAILAEGAPGLFHRIPLDRQVILVEAAHLSYGTLGGMLFGRLPERLRHHDWVGPAYGVLFWVIYAAGIAPVLGIAPARRAHRTGQWLALLADHVLYGVVVAASPWPYQNRSHHGD